MKRSRGEEEEKEENSLRRNREKRRRRNSEEEEMRERRSRQDGGRVKLEERILRGSPEMGPVESWRCNRREKERNSEISGSEEEPVRSRERMEKEEKGGIERERQHIGEYEDKRERSDNILTQIFLNLSSFLVSQYFNLIFFYFVFFSFLNFWLLQA